MLKKARVHIFISGKVQGVFFRAETLTKAEELGLFGWVKNLENGKVEVLTEGEEEKIKELIGWLKRGPVLSKVDRLDLKWQEHKGEFKNFEIKREKQ